MPFLEVAGGALIGGGVSLVTTLVTESRKRRSELDQEDRGQRREILKALRLLESECRANFATLTVIKEREDGPWFPPDLPMVTQAWNNYEATLALHPDQGLWHSVDSFYTAMWAADQIAEKEGRTDTARNSIGRACEIAENAMGALQEAIREVAPPDPS
jgi:hypothetical protein